MDATNLVRPVVALISTISKDHEAYLGSDLLSIAREKGGIIKQGISAVCGALPTEVAALLKDIAHERAAPSYFLGRDFIFSLKNEDRFDYTGLKWRLSDLEIALRENGCSDARQDGVDLIPRSRHRLLRAAPRCQPQRGHGR